MSGKIYTKSVAIPIPQRNKYCYSIPQKAPSKYLFELKLQLKDGNYKTIRKIDENRYTNLLENDDNIDYENIVSYYINISILPENIEQNFNNSGYLKTYMTFFSNQENNIYIEFNRLNNGKATCTCRYVDYDNLGLSISPPF